MSLLKVKCNLCSKDYNKKERTPRMLLCGHTYCTECVQNLETTEDNFIKCPSCGSDTTCNSVSDLLINFALLDLANHFKDERKKRESRVILNDTSARTNYVVSMLRRKHITLEEDVANHNRNIMNLKDQIDSIEQSKATLFSQQKEIINTIEKLELLEQEFTEDDMDELDSTLKYAEEYIGFMSKMNPLQDAQPMPVVPSNKYAVLIEGGRTRYAKTTSLGKIGYRLHVLTSSQPNLASRYFQYPQLTSSSTQDSMIFLELNWTKQCQGKVVIQLFKDIPRGQILYNLCSGRRGISLREIPSLSANQNGPSEVTVKFGLQSEAAEETFLDLINNDEGLQTRPSSPGLVTVSVSNDPISRMQFYVTVRNQPGPDVKNVIGEVISGLEVLRSAARYEPSSERPVVVEDCGLIIHH